MYHQFKELADVDITKEPMEVGPTCHYMMGGVRVDAETQRPRVPGLFAAGEVAGGMHGANRLGRQLALATSWSSAGAPALHAAQYAKDLGGALDGRRRARSTQIAREVLEPFDADRRREPVRASTTTCRTRCRTWSASSAPRRSCKKALEELERAARSAPTRVQRRAATAQYNPGWHLALDLRSHARPSREAMARAALERKESRGGHTRDDYPEHRRRASARSTS